MSDSMAIESGTLDAEELREAARRLLADRVDRRAPFNGAPHDRGGEALFDAMVELGWTLLTLPEAMDGLGQSFAALGPIYEEMGGALSPVALAPTMASLELLAVHSATDAARDLARRVASGAARVAVAIVDGGLLNVEGAGDRFTVSGRLESVVTDSGTTDLLLLSVGTEDRALLLSLQAPGVSLTFPEMWDRSRRVADIVLDDALALPAVTSRAGAAIDRVRAHIDLALAWDSLGGARRSLEDTIAYMHVREQFGRPIGSFQALKHRAADHKVGLEVAAAVARDATAAFAEGRAMAGTIAGQARLIANEAYRTMAEDSVQLHGGIGFTWEHDCHLFLKRALLNEMLYGSPDQRRDRIAPAIFARALANRTG